MPRPSLASSSVLIATWFGAGYLPKAPGTWGSLAALPFAWIIMQYHGFGILIGASIALFFVGIWSANGYMAQTGTHDPGPVVVDEVVGQWLVLSILPLDLGWYLVGFAAFRLFDIVKPWPIKWLDQKVEGGFGVMIDDVGAAAFGVLLLLGIRYVMEHML
ncbi:MAG: phosphatidylglycerophosphatase A [Rhodospirillales bacterium]|jgi:phosphatidylglycerophosphatase A|nr:phosphatidylglycerophosphatase A [Rhodospirillales bacterium]MBT4041692.1 phosphatidylglycerophosphatase A [Rhodospirillales bacterium]MBT4626396.1 phosphatidylglycerophosphatase A [Rhodospirillales bacterium]MBT5350116.1 phosphatidylglycerophosphatase A [Rhodospirillales bacterium]MBT5520370.1 phosphatidylglycerophosphatase A [Rhodospirillales bacterium]